ncbi:multiple epidermal growth factor domains protein 11 [Biomphalaria glabrata]|nr:multiple epidermal growth factor domains protein 11 [Biomphalaria glabrata]
MGYPCSAVGARGEPQTSRQIRCPWKTICPEDCPDGKWGYNCTETCLQCEVVCDKFNGECDECSLGYMYSDSTKRICDKNCPEFTYGKMCKFKCKEKCGGDCAERLHGTCPACKSRKWGKGCTEDCPPFCDGECSSDKGHCSSCMPGYQNEQGEAPRCQMECPDGSYGPNCKQMCPPNCAEICDKKTGACSKCKKGYFHSQGAEDCKNSCPPMFYGDGCKGSCQTKCGMECLDKGEGTCPDCPEGMWGLGCSSNCGENCIGPCSRSTGECDGCSRGFTKDSRHLACDKECDDMHFGMNCESSCEEKCGRECAEKVEGTCKPCETGTWGFGCKNLCSKNCFQDCNNKTGECMSCKPGFRNAPNDKTCMADCPPMTYGRECNGSCSVKCNGQDCVEKVLGLCINCPKFRWGQDCSNECSPNCDDICDQATGECKVCKKGFTSISRKEPFCQLKCPPMTFGLNCEGLCMDKCGAECLEKVEGTCRGSKVVLKMLGGVVIVLICLALLYYFSRRGTEKNHAARSVSASTSYDYQRSSNSAEPANELGGADSYGSDIDEAPSRHSQSSSSN